MSGNDWTCQLQVFCNNFQGRNKTAFYGGYVENSVFLEAAGFEGSVVFGLYFDSCGSGFWAK
jgi:hypothetical protein